MNGAECLPEGLQDNPLVQRRSSVFHDLITVFRRNTGRRESTERTSIDYILKETPRTSITHVHAHRVEVQKDNEQPDRPEPESDAFIGKVENREREVDEDGQPLTKTALLERIRQKKEVIGKLRCQAWSMTRKRRTLKLAQKYLEQNESKVSKSHLYMEEMKKRMRAFKRSFSNFKTYLIPWEGKIKKIESHYGSVVSSYFTFLRWIVFVNIIITLIVIAFVVMPEMIADSTADMWRKNATKSRKIIPADDRVHADKIAVVWHYDGYLRYSPLFYGYYSDAPYLGERVRYSLPLAYFLVTIFIFAYSFFAILRKMASNARSSKLTGSKTEQYVYNWKVFTGWDYTIGNSETASNAVMAVVIKLRESIADTKVEGHGKFQCLQFTLRVIANVLICSMLAFSIYCITLAVKSSQTTVEQEGNLFTKNQVPSVVSTITHVFPMIFDLIGRMENYHPRNALRAHLGRVLILYVLNYLTFIFALFDKLNNLRKNVGSHSENTKTKRQLGGWNPNINRPPPFASRTFENKAQLLDFIDKSTQRFEVRRTTRKAPTTPYTQVAPQFGPVNVNNPNAILRNGTMSRDFESNRVGPQDTNLPVFTPPPRRKTSTPFNRVDQEYGGPDFDKTTRMYTKPTAPSRVRTKPPWEYPPVGPDPTGDLLPASQIPKSNDTVDLEYNTPTNQTKNIKMGEQAPRKSNADDINDGICWETFIGQEIVKLVTMDLVFTICSIMVIDFLRGLWIRYCSSWWCWDIESTFPEYGEFKVAENVIHIIYNQGMIWLGLFFAPLLPLLNNVKLIIIMYIRGWACLTCNVPAREVFRASRSSNFYLLILLFWLLLCTLPVGYVITSRNPSRTCGPFAQYQYFYSIAKAHVDETVWDYIKHIASPGVVIPILIFLILIIYFLVSLVRGLREANSDLQQQLIHERTEEKKKIFELAGGGKRRENEREKEKDKRKAIQYVPLIEQKRREPWRIYNEVEPDDTRASDSSSGSDDEDEPPSPIAVHHQQPTSVPPSTATIHQLSTSPKTNAQSSIQQLPQLSSENTLQVMHFHPSLGSLMENEEEEELGEVAVATVQVPVHMSPSSSSMLSKEIHSNSSDINSGIIQIATPEEIRAFLRPFYLSPPSSFHEIVPAVHHLRRFPVTSSCFASSSSSSLHSPPPVHRSSTANSVALSVYDCLQATEGTSTSINGNKLEKAILRKEENDAAKTLKQMKDNASKFDVSGIQPEFQPWPSLDEVKERRERMQKREPLPLGKPADSNKPSSSDFSSKKTASLGQPAKVDVHEYRPPVPIHRKIEASDLSDSSRREDSPTKRFRISVSPTKTIKMSDKTEDRIAMVRQASATSSLAPSTQNLARDVNENPVNVPQVQLSLSSKAPMPGPSDSLSPRAPRVEFGEDDSPRVLF